jgi:hypothetical protein
MSDELPVTSSILQKAWMASDNYIRRMLLPLESGPKELDVPIASVYNTSLIELNKLKGISGVVVSYQEEAAKQDISVRDGGKFADWFEIAVPPDECIMDLDKDIKSQSRTVLTGIMSHDAIDVLFPDEAEQVRKRVEAYARTVPAGENIGIDSYESSTFYEQKRADLDGLKTIRSYISFLNQRGRNDILEPCMTASYLYNCCGIRGLRYKDPVGDRILIFNARKDIEILQIWRTSVAA